MLKGKVTSGVPSLDELLDKIYIGDNVVWYDHAGSLAWSFCYNFMQSSLAARKPVIFVSFDRSPRILLERLGKLAETQDLTILDCFTWGKGAGTDIFTSFYEESRSEWPCRIIKLDEPGIPREVIETLYSTHSELQGDVRFVFESLTGMQELWGGEEYVSSFYSHSCPRLYELNTVAYWIIEKSAHSSRLHAQINQIAQVVIDLSIKRGKTSLSILKADKREIENREESYMYWTKGSEIVFEDKSNIPSGISLGLRLKELRTRRGVSQTDLARQVGVTPSSISQIESNLIYPSLPALFKMAEVLSVAPSTFFQEMSQTHSRYVFPSNESTEIKLPNVPEGILTARALGPENTDARAELYMIEFGPKKKLSSHFILHKGQEMGYVISGKLHVTIRKSVHKLQAGDAIHLTTDIPEQWRNPGTGMARLLWIKLR